MTLDLNTVKTVSVIAIGVLVLLAVLMAAIVRAVVGKILLVVLLIGLAGVVYWQRDQLSSCFENCRCTFFGQQVTLPDAVSKQCT
ncbi:hypothetical protein [Cumulibacter manganitolerans]|uniref:hypothetical protein n=1 Tax=Cumulibacter manganitolerans TaxID=1884992 RepID=UPI001294D172|nr:hypothetical protein [Cumulibacter manganitolerans]